ncbi:MAG: ABC transporter family substrate-binding protein [Acidimicrobiia bacterium]
MKLQRRPFGVMLTLLVATSVAFAGCGGDDDEQASDKKQGTEDTAKTGEGTQSGGVSATSNDLNPMPRDQLRDGGTLTTAIAEFPPNFNAGHLDGSLADTAAVVGPLLGAPFVFDAAAQPVVNPDYVTSAKLTATEPKQVLTYVLNPKAIWYDGTPITWEDYKWEWMAHNGTNPAYKVSSTQGYDKIESVERGKDDYEVVVTFSEPYTDWQVLFSGLYPKSTNMDPAVFNDGWKDKPLTTSGPFKLDNINQTAQTITLVRNEKWWGRPAKLERLIYRVIAIEAHVDALANKEIDYVDVGPDVNNLRRVEEIEGIDIRRAGGPNFRHLTINGTGEVLSDVKVRRALGLAINRQTIAEAILKPLGVKAQPLNNHIFMLNQAGYEDNAGDLGTYDPEAAKALLDEAGWVEEGGVRKKDGKTLSIRIVIPSQVPVSEQEATIVRAMLEVVGVKLEIDTVPTAGFFDQYIKKGDFDITLFSWIGTPFPVSSTRSIYGQPEGDAVQQNYGRIGGDKIDMLYEEATREFDREAQMDMANQIDTLIWENVHSLTFYQRPEIVAVRENLANFGASGFASVPIEDVGYVK